MTATDPRAVITAPIYNQEALIGSAIESILAQKQPDFALILVDDCSTDGTGQVAREIAEGDPRVTYLRNDQRLGMLNNTRLAFALARGRFPRAEYVALGSDHDLWHPDWLSALTEALDADREAVLAYPLVERIALDGEVTRKPWCFDTGSISEPRKRLRASFRGSAGEMMYGLIRAVALDRTGVYRSVLVPDRLLVAELALQGRFSQVDRVLWRRRLAVPGDLDRQRRAFFMDRVPWRARVPWLLTHAAVLASEYAGRGKGRPELGRTAGLALTLDYLRGALWTRLRNRVIESARAVAQRPRLKSRLLRIRALGPPRVAHVAERLLDEGIGLEWSDHERDQVRGRG